MRRRRPALSFGILLIGMMAAFFAGPRLETAIQIRPPALPADLDRYLTDRESRFADITPGTEKTIVWHRAPGIRTESALVYIHGFSATRRETAPLAERVAGQLAANLYYTRLTGHGRGGEAMLDGSVNAWLNDTVEAMAIGRRLGRKVIMMGVSTGAAAVTWLAAQPDADALAAVILVSPNFAPANPSANVLLWPWGRQIAELALGRERHWQAENPPHARYWTTRYPTAALLPMMGMVKLAGELDLGRITTPFLVIYSPADQVVSPRATESAFAALGSARKQIIPYRRSQDPSQHVLAGEVLSPDSTAEVAAMIVRFIASRP